MKLSIITINYNNASGLEKTIKSIIPILGADIEYIVIDGASTDNSRDIIKQYSANITYWTSEPDEGIFDAMNKGTNKAKGEYLLYINSGDIVNENVDIQRILDNLNNHDIIYYDIRVIGEEQNIDFVKSNPNYLDFKFFVEDTLPHQSTFIKKDFIVHYGGYPKYTKFAGDWILFIDAICRKECTYKHVDEVFSTYFLDGITAQPDNFKLLWEEKNEHIRIFYPIYNSFYEDYISKRQELYKLKVSVSVRFLKKIGFLKWLKM